MFPIVFQLGGFRVGAYGLFAALGVWSAVGLTAWLARRAQVPPWTVVTLAFSVVAAGLVGCKLGFLAAQAARGASWSSVEALRQGGVIHAGIAAGAAMLFIQVRARGLSFLRVGDVAAPGVFFACAVGRVGCLLAGCCHGSPSDLPWAVTFDSAEAHALSGTPLGIPVHPAQLYAGAWSLACAAATTWLLSRRLREGAVVAAYFVLEGMGRVVLETWRGDAGRGVGLAGISWLSAGRLSGLAFVAMGLALALWLKKKAAPLGGLQSTTGVLP
jgi:phosphatidylglycerol:prolipoprotein diacylglycerol transferase